MSAPAPAFNRRLLFAFATACATAFFSVASAQDGSVSSVPATEVAQTIARVRSSSVNENLLSQAVILGGALLRSGRFNEAAELFDALAEKKPNDAAVLYGEALATFNSGRPTEAEPLARRAVEAALNDRGIAGANDRARSSADALVLLAVILAVKGDDAAALKTVQQAVRHAPDNFDAQLALGRVLFGMGDDVGAARAFRAASALKPSNAQALFFLASSLERGGDIKSALGTYRQLVELQPQMTEGHLGLGVLLLKRGGTEADEGVKELERALEIDPNLYEARVTLGRALIARGRPDEAIEHLRRAAQLAPGNPEPHYQLSLAYRRLGRNDEAASQSAIVKRIHESRRNGRVASNPDRD